MVSTVSPETSAVAGTRVGHCSNAARWTFLLCIGVAYGYRATILLAAALHIPSRALTVPYRIVFLAFTLFILLRYRRVVIWSFSVSPLMQCLGIFWALYGVRLLCDLFLFPADLRYRPWEYVSLAFGGTLLPALAFAHQTNWNTYRKAFRPFLVGAFLTTLISAWLFRDILGTSFGRINFGSTGIAFGSLNAGYLASSVVVMGTYLIIERRSRSQIIIGAILCSLAIPSLALGASRGPVLAILVCVAVHLYAQFRRRNFQWSLLLILAAVVSLPILRYSFDLLGSNLFLRFHNPDIQNLAHANTRISIWKDALSQFSENPLVGAGLEVSNWQLYPHNIVIESFLATGLIGGLAFVIFLTGTWLKAIRLLCQPASARSVGWIGLLFIHYSINGMFSQSIYSNVGFWAFGIAVIAASQYPNVASALATRVDPKHDSALAVRLYT